MKGPRRSSSAFPLLVAPGISPSTSGTILQPTAMKPTDARKGTDAARKGEPGEGAYRGQQMAKRGPQPEYREWCLR